MKEQPLFAPGQEIVCIDTPKHRGLRHGYASELIEGKKYHVSNPKYEVIGEIIFIRLEGLKHAYNQKYFVPASFDRYAEETFHQSLKGKPVNA